MQMYRHAKELLALALEGLKPLYNSQQKLYTYRMWGGHLTAMPLAWSVVYTAINLIGLSAVRTHGCQEALTTWSEDLESVVKHSSDTRRFGDIGLILWADATQGSQFIDVLLPLVEKGTSPERLACTPTTELAWLLTGLALATCNSRSADRAGELASVYYEALLKNYNQDTKLFCHTWAKTHQIDLRTPIGNFADQAYAIFALTEYYELTGTSLALQSALQCARCICALQGKQGQWWWHYDTQRGTVVSRFPVYSVHQDGMAPMALRRVMAVSKEDFTAPIERGLDWLFSDNELHTAMVCRESSVIWRDIERRSPVSYARYLSLGLSRLGLPRLAQAIDRPFLCAVNREMRPYELGWLVYAFADQSQQSS
jgi:hypothetical protein